MSEPRGICPPDHAHGTTTVCYLHHRCGCAGCRQAMTQRARDRRRQLAYGTYTRARVDAAPVREHLAMLRAHGLGVHYIEKAIAVPRITLAGIIWGRLNRHGQWIPAKTVTADIAARILALQPTLEVIADGAVVDARGATRRLHALAALGWSAAELARRLGKGEHNMQRIANATKLTAATVRQIEALYDELWDKRPLADTPTRRAMIARTIARAQRNGWVAPLAWDDIDNDEQPADPIHVEETTADADPGQVDEIAIALAVRGETVTLTTEERHIVVRTLNARGYTDTQIAHMAGCTSRTVLRDRIELNIPAAVGPDRERIAS